MKNIKNNIPQGLLSVAGAIALATLSAPMMAGSASAATVSFQVGTAATDSVDVDYDVKISDIAGGVQIDVNQAATSPNSADILGLFFNVQPGNASNFGITSASQFTKLAGDAITQVCFNTTSCGSGNNINGGTMPSPFDIGMKLGSTGSSGGLVKFSSFTIASASLTTANFLNQAFAVRAQTAGSNPTTGGSGSVKELGFAPSTVDTITPPPPGGGGTGAVPEPLTMLGAGAAVAFGSYFKKRANKNSNKA
jgi:hypothetical protein